MTPPEERAAHQAKWKELYDSLLNARTTSTQPAYVPAAMKLGSKTDPQIPLSERANQLARSGEVTDIGLQLVREGYSAREVHNHLEETGLGRTPLRCVRFGENVEQIVASTVAPGGRSRLRAMREIQTRPWKSNYNSMMARGGKRSGAGRPKGSKSKESAIVKAERKKIEAVVEARRREIGAGVEIAKEQIGETARRYAAVALEALAVTAVYGEGMVRVQAARELLDRGYGKVPEPAAEPPLQIMEGIVIEPLRKYNGNGSDEPVRLEDWRKDP